MARRATPGKVKGSSRVRDEARALYRKAILDAAEAVFAEKGMHVARVQDVAARAGLSVGAIYNYFEQKEDILVALLGERMTAVVQEFETQPGDPSAFEANLVARTTRFLRYAAAHRAFFQVATEHGLIGPGNYASEALLGGKKVKDGNRFELAVRAVVLHGIAKGHLAAMDVDLLTLHLRHTLKSASVWLRDRAAPRFEDTAQQAIDLFLSGAAKKRR